MGLFKNYVSQTRKPEGFLGKMMLQGMNSGHAKMADWGMSHLRNLEPESIVDLGARGMALHTLIKNKDPKSQMYSGIRDPFQLEIINGLTVYS